MAKHAYDTMLLPGEELMYKIPGVYDLSHQNENTTGTLYITNFQSFFVDDSKDKIAYTIPHGCITKTKKYKNQHIKSVPLTDKSQYLELSCKDLRVVKYILPASSHPNEVRRYLDFVSLPENFSDIFAFGYSPLHAALDEGWNIYNPIQEYKRLGLITSEQGPWRVSDINTKFVLCPTYPEVLIVPVTIDDKVLTKVGDFRSKARIPSCVWKHPNSSATISRCSQPLVGMGGKKSEDDEALLREIQKANTEGKDKPLHIIDARPKVNATACTLSGGGTEILGNYTESHATLEYCGIANIHVVRESFKKLGNVCRSWDRKSKWSDVVGTHWLDHISSILSAACRMVTYVDTDGCSLLVHCTDGWDRTSQLCALAELLMDPYYRTIKGFIVLICKEFLSFGHKFSTRNGHVSYTPRSQCAPIFIQFIDCVWQFTRQFPTSFEFSESLLLLLNTHLHSHIFGTFLCDNEAERGSLGLQEHTASLWGLILQAPPALAIHLTNPMYYPHPGTLHGNGSVNGMQLWREYYQRSQQSTPNSSLPSENGTAGTDNSKEGSHTNGTGNGTNGSENSMNGTQKEKDVILIHGAALLPFLDNLSQAERDQMKKDMGVWLSMGGGKVKDKVSVVTAKRPPMERKESRFGSMRIASHSNGANNQSHDHHHHGHHHHGDNQAEGEGEGDEGSNGIKRGRSFSTVFARMTGKGKDKEKEKEKERESEKEKGRGRANSEDSKSHLERPTTTTTTTTTTTFPKQQSEQSIHKNMYTEDSVET